MDLDELDWLLSEERAAKDLVDADPVADTDEFMDKVHALAIAEATLQRWLRNNAEAMRDEIRELRDRGDCEACFNGFPCERTT